MQVLEALGAPSLSRDPASGPSLPPKLCAPPATGRSPHEYVQSPNPPPRQHLAPAAGWRGWCCPQCWRLGRCRPRRCFAPPSGSAAFRSAPRVGVSEGGPWHLLAHSGPQTPLHFRGQPAEGGSRPGSEKPGPSPSSGGSPSLVSPPLSCSLFPGHHLPHTVQAQDSPALDSGPGRGPVLGASKSPEVGGYLGPHTAG